MAGLSVSFRVESSASVSVDHNNRAFFAHNVVESKSPENITYVKEDVREFYDKVFGEALNEYNERQKQPCRRISDYYEHLENSKQEKPFYEIVVQFGDKDTAGCGTRTGDVVKQMLDEYMKDFEKRNPNLKVFNAVLHMDEATPHLHINFVPVAENQNPNRGLRLKNSMVGALRQQGFNSDKQTQSERIKWTEAEKKEMERLLAKRDLTIDVKNVSHKHKSVEAFKQMKDTQQNRQKRITELLKNSPETLTQEETQTLTAEVSKLRKEKEMYLRTIHEAKTKLTDDFVFHKIVNEEKLQYVAEELRKKEIPFGEDGLGLQVPASELPQVKQIEKMFVPSAHGMAWREELKLRIDRLIYKVSSYDGLMNELRKSGYIVRDKNRKYTSVKPAYGNFRAVRLKNFGNEYTPEALEERIASKDNFRNNTEQRLMTAKGLREDCLTAMHTVVVLIYDYKKFPRKLNNKRCYSVENDYHVNLIAEQLKLVERDGIADENDLQNRIENLQKEVDTLSEKLNALNKTQINAKDLIAKTEFYFSNSGVRLDSMQQMKYDAAGDLLTRYNIATAADIEKIKSVYKLNAEKNVPALKEKISAFSQKQDSLLKLKRTLDRIKDKDFAASLQAPSVQTAADTVVPTKSLPPKETPDRQKHKDTKR
jgi:hypothetical protein